MSVFSAKSETPTNLLRLASAIKREDGEGMKQMILYDPGAGPDGMLGSIIGGRIGEGLDVSILEIYTFLASNYDHGDEIYMFGFSRGSYIIRSVAEMIYEVGLVSRIQLDHVNEAYKLYRDNDFESEQAVSFRAQYGERIKIELVACFETVGLMGIPLQGFGLMRNFIRERYELHRTTLSEDTENAIHILGIDEEGACKLFIFSLKYFAETLWIKELTKCLKIE